MSQSAWQHTVLVCMRVNRSYPLWPCSCFPKHGNPAVKRPPLKVCPPSPWFVRLLTCGLCHNLPKTSPYPTSTFQGSGYLFFGCSVFFLAVSFLVCICFLLCCFVSIARDHFPFFFAPLHTLQNACSMPSCKKYTNGLKHLRESR